MKSWSIAGGFPWKWKEFQRSEDFVTYHWMASPTGFAVAGKCSKGWAFVKIHNAVKKSSNWWVECNKFYWARTCSTDVSLHDCHYGSLATREGGTNPWNSTDAKNHQEYESNHYCKAKFCRRFRLNPCSKLWTELHRSSDFFLKETSFKISSATCFREQSRPIASLLHPWSHCLIGDRDTLHVGIGCLSFTSPYLDWRLQMIGFQLTQPKFNLHFPGCDFVWKLSQFSNRVVNMGLKSRNEWSWSSFFSHRGA